MYTIDIDGKLHEIQKHQITINEEGQLLSYMYYGNSCYGNVFTVGGLSVLQASEVGGGNEENVSNKYIIL